MKKSKLFLSLVCLCFSLAILCFCFGVYAAKQVNYLTSGNITYHVSDVFVTIETKVYYSNNKFNQQELHDLILEEALFDSSLFHYDSTKSFPIYNSLSNRYSNTISQDLNFSSEKKTFGFASKINNLSKDNVFWALIDSIDINGSNNIIYESNYYLSFVKNKIEMENDQYLFVLFSIDDVTESIENVSYDIHFEFDTDNSLLTKKLYNDKFEMGTMVSGTGELANSTNRIRTSEFIDILDIEKIEINDDYKIAYFIYDCSKNFLGGSGWLSNGQDVIISSIYQIARYQNLRYLKFIFAKNNDATLSLEDDIENSDLNFILYDLESSIFEFEGDIQIPYGVSNLNKFKYKIKSKFNSCQDGAYYNDKIFSFNNDGVCYVYSANSYKLLQTFTLDKSNLIKPHSNSVCFGKDKFSENDEYPLLYANVYNNYASDVDKKKGYCCVYRITENNNTITSELVQIIKIGFTEDNNLWSSTSDIRPYGNFVVDVDLNKLYVFVMKDSSPRVTRFFKFNIPSLSVGEYDSTYQCNVVTLQSLDILEYFDLEYSNYLQGCCIYNNSLITLEGNSSGTNSIIKFIDLTSKSISAKIYLSGIGLNQEFEMVDVCNNELYLISINGYLYKFKFI